MGKLSATICVPFGAETVENDPCTVGTTRNYTTGTGNRQNTSAQAKERNRTIDMCVEVCGRCCVIEEFPLCGGGSTYRINEI
jgi:hypothetical protein